MYKWTIYGGINVGCFFRGHMTRFVNLLQIITLKFWLKHKFAKVLFSSQKDVSH